VRPKVLLLIFGCIITILRTVPVKVVAFSTIPSADLVIFYAPVRYLLKTDMSFLQNDSLNFVVHCGLWVSGKKNPKGSDLKTGLSYLWVMPYFATSSWLFKM
jgi:hypothetical protein